MGTPTAPSGTSTPPWQLYTVEEAAPILSMGVSTLYRLCKAGLPHTNVRGVGIRFTATNLDEIIREGQRGKTR